MEFWKNVLWSEVTKLGLFGFVDQGYVWCIKGKAYEQKKTITMVKKGCGPELLLVCFAESGHFDCIKDIVDSLKYQTILAKTEILSVHRLRA